MDLRNAISDKQWKILKCLNPFEGRPLTQKETAIFLGISERTVKRIFKQFKKDFPEAYKSFIKLKKSTNLLGRRLKKPLLFYISNWTTDQLTNNSLFGKKVVKIWQ